MVQVDENVVRAALSDYLVGLKSGFDGDVQSLGDDVDLLFDGLIDSLGLLGLLASLRDSFGADLDFEDLDPEETTIVGPLCRYIAKRADRSREYADC